MESSKLDGFKWNAAIFWGYPCARLVQNVENFHLPIHRIFWTFLLVLFKFRSKLKDSNIDIIKTLNL
jgi:hypothetical protein